jgi:hypothetical protein
MIRMRTIGFTFAAALSSVLAACGGGGGTGGNTSSHSATVSGAASKGLLLDAPVTFYGVSNGAVGTTAIGSTTTDTENGTFSSTVTSSGAVVVTVTVNSSTQMLDELSGTAITAPSGLVLHAVFDSLTDLQPLAVTPLTEMAYQIANASSGGLTTTNIDAANNAVSTVFLNGAPVLSTQPINLANYASATAAEQEQAKLLAALAIAANEGTATGSAGQPCTGSYAQNIVCMIGGLPALVSMNASGITANAGYLADAYAALDSDAVTVQGGMSPSALGLDTPTAAETAFDTAFQTQNPLPGFSSSGVPLTNTKDLVANIRTNIVDQSATQTFGYAPTLTALQNDYNTNVGPIINSTSSLVNDFRIAANLLQSGSVGYRGNCGYDPSNLGTGSNTALCSYLLYGTAERIRLTVTMSGPNSYSVQTQPLVDFSSGQCTYSNPITYGCPVKASYPALSAQASWVSTDVEGASLNGPYYVTGSGGQITAALSVAESSNWDATTDTGTITLSGQLTGGSGGISLSSATLGSDSVLQVQNLSRLSDTSSLITTGLPPVGVSGTIDLTAFVTSAFSYAAKVVLGTPVVDKSGAAEVPGTITVTGSIDQLNAGVSVPLFSGSVGVNFQNVPSFDATQPISATNFFTVQGQVSGSLSLPGGRILTLSATANASQLTPTPAQADSATVTYSYVTPSGTAVLDATGQYDATNGYSGTITNNAGVVIAVAKPIDGALTGTITASGTETATINGDFVYYSDGTSESLF